MMRRVRTRRGEAPSGPNDERIGLHTPPRNSIHRDARTAGSPAGALHERSPPSSSTSDSCDNVYQDACAYAAATSSGTEEEEEVLAGKQGHGYHQRHPSSRATRFQPLQLPSAGRSVGKESCSVTARGGSLSDGSPCLLPFRQCFRDKKCWRCVFDPWLRRLICKVCRAVRWVRGDFACC